nr:hypothetical protein [Phascolarctobacterium succinatutens]
MGIDDEFCNNCTNQKYKSKISVPAAKLGYAGHDYPRLEIRLHFPGLDRNHRNLIEQSRNYSISKCEQ